MAVAARRTAFGPAGSRHRAQRRSIRCQAERKQTTIHKLIEQEGVLLVPGCYDALSAKCLAKAGHKAAFVSGYAVCISARLLDGRRMALGSAAERPMGSPDRSRARSEAQPHSCTAAAQSHSSRTAAAQQPPRRRPTPRAAPPPPQVSATLLGEPDLGLLTPPEMARKTGQICYSVPTLPVLADADTGGGNVLNVQRTIKQLISSGAKGAFIEDQQWPKRAGHMRNKEVIRMEEFAGGCGQARAGAGPGAGQPACGAAAARSGAGAAARRAATPAATPPARPPPRPPPTRRLAAAASPRAQPRSTRRARPSAAPTSSWWRAPTRAARAPSMVWRTR
jgi:hypothetical protein